MAFHSSLTENIFISSIMLLECFSRYFPSPILLQMCLRYPELIGPVSDFIPLMPKGLKISFITQFAFICATISSCPPPVLLMPSKFSHTYNQTSNDGSFPNPSLYSELTLRYCQLPRTLGLVCQLV